MGSLEKRVADLITTRDLLRVAHDMKCTCPGFYLQYNQGCTCKRGQEIKRLEEELKEKLNHLDDYRHNGRIDNEKRNNSALRAGKFGIVARG